MVIYNYRLPQCSNYLERCSKVFGCFFTCRNELDRCRFASTTLRERIHSIYPLTLDRSQLERSLILPSTNMLKRSLIRRSPIPKTFT